MRWKNLSIGAKLAFGFGSVLLLMAVAGSILERLVSYTVYHFGFEEKLFQKHGYPEHEQHKKAHENLVAKVKEFKTKVQSGDATISMELMNFLKD